MCWNSDKCISLQFTFFFYCFKCKIYTCREGVSFVIQCSYFTDKITFLGRYFILQFQNSFCIALFQCYAIQYWIAFVEMFLKLFVHKLLLYTLQLAFCFEFTGKFTFIWSKKESLLFLVFLLTILSCSIKASMCVWSIWLGTFSIDNAEIR